MGKIGWQKILKTLSEKSISPRYLVKRLPMEDVTSDPFFYLILKYLMFAIICHQDGYLKFCTFSMAMYVEAGE